MLQFKIDSVYYCRSIGDQNCIWLFRVVSRTEKTMTIKDISNGKTYMKKLSAFENVEVCNPLGQYSKAPVLGADALADDFLPHYLHDFTGKVRWLNKATTWAAIHDNQDADEVWKSNGGFIEVVAESKDGEYNGGYEILDKEEAMRTLPHGMPCLIREFTGKKMEVLINENIDAEDWYGDSNEENVRCYILPTYFREIAKELSGETIPDNAPRIKEPIKGNDTSGEKKLPLPAKALKDIYATQIKQAIENNSNLLVWQNQSTGNNTIDSMCLRIVNASEEAHITSVFNHGITPYYLDHSGEEYKEICLRTNQEVLEMMKMTKGYFSKEEMKDVTSSFMNPKDFTIWKLESEERLISYVVVLHS